MGCVFGFALGEVEPLDQHLETQTSARSLPSSAPTSPYNAKLCLNGHEWAKTWSQNMACRYVIFRS